VRAFVVGGVLLAVLMPFTNVPFLHPELVLAYGVLGSLLMGGLGLVAGIWSNKFDDVALVNNFLIMPLTFLSGVFYSVKQLPPLWQQVNHYNPFFYLIDGFRFGFLGVGDTEPFTALCVVTAAAAICVGVCWRLWRIGWRLKE
jgi:ABC-2 type transport system permease protein